MHIRCIAAVTFALALALSLAVTLLPVLSAHAVTDSTADWVEFVVCGDRTCAQGSADYDADEISHAQRLYASVVAFDVTGSDVRWISPVAVTSDGTGFRVAFTNP